MIKVIIVSPHQDHFSDFASAFSGQRDVEIDRVESGAQALEVGADSSVDLMVADEVLGDMTGLDLATQLVKLNPMINCACVSPLSPDAFHEASEGLGVMPQLPPMPGKKEGEALLFTLRQLKGEL